MESLWQRMIGSRRAFLSIILALASLFISADGKFLLSCRVISGICQEDGMCLHEMGNRFPDCYMDLRKRVLTENPVLRPTLNVKSTDFHYAYPLNEDHQVVVSNIDATNPNAVDFYFDDVPLHVQSYHKAAFEKRGMKLRNILMKVDRIPVG